MYRLIHVRLLGGSINGIGNVLLADNYFAMVALWRALHSRGIYAIGPSKASRPKKGANANSWPFQTYEKGDETFLARGWRRTASTPLAGL